MAKPTYTTWELDPTWAHYANVISAVPFSENTGTPADLVGGNTVTFTGCVWTVADGSGAIVGAKDADGDVFGVDVVPPATGTVIIIYDPGNGLTSATDSFWGTTTSENTGARRATGNLRFQVAGTFCHNSATGNTNWATVSADQILIQTWTSGSQLMRLDATESTSTATTGTPTGDFRMQEGVGVADNGIQVLGWVILDTNLSSAEASAVEASPWAWAREAAAGASIPIFMHHYRHNIG